MSAASVRGGAVSSSWFRRPWMGVLSRSLAAIFGGYALAASTGAFLAVALPIARSQAVLTGMLLAILVCACAALWAFATASAWKAWAGILIPTALLALTTWLLTVLA
ncbi:DUF3649 domain-containing protein [Pseudoxanthomonas winnipegensis]|uniref:DUF3649 domain-containing protein n=1 Tax=Pseudoxanthomonas winnipegensis TaxID=2480810 RepID=A0A4Q8LRJ4_9GAMM|nr:DUF3649 domain-containing protein [Pseudoxanthomonas winnipegensis]RZZ88030.1 DUF3649 domain-containing protein [Pseudoxanthomonas winnipegensis]TAA34312.1 DUF3649 domain-containing protein [Pseudoxanthomonas winnipegensis]